MLGSFPPRGQQFVLTGIEPRSTYRFALPVHRAIDSAIDSAIIRVLTEGVLLHGTPHNITNDGKIGGRVAPDPWQPLVTPHTLCHPQAAAHRRGRCSEIIICEARKPDSRTLYTT